MQAINIQFASTSSVAIPNAIAQRITVGDATNPSFLRYMIVTDKYIKINPTRNTASVIIMFDQILSASVAADPVHLTWPPLITSESNATQSVVSPGTGSFSISVSSELPVTYSWQYKAPSTSTWITASVAASSSLYSGSLTAYFYAKAFTTASNNNYSFRCLTNNLAGSTTGSTGTINIT